MGSVLGDAMVATVPPLELVIDLSIDDAGGVVLNDEAIAGSAATFADATAQRCEFRANGSILAEREAATAYRMMMYGFWEEEERVTVAEDRLSVQLRYIYRPPCEHAPGKSLGVGFLSTMVSKAYLRGADDLVHTTSSDAILDPGFMKTFLPEDFAESFHSLKITMLHIQPSDQI